MARCCADVDGEVCGIHCALMQKQDQGEHLAKTGKRLHVEGSWWRGLDEHPLYTWAVRRRPHLDMMMNDEWPGPAGRPIAGPHKSDHGSSRCSHRVSCSIAGHLYDGKVAPKSRETTTNVMYGAFTWYSWSDWQIEPPRTRTEGLYAGNNLILYR